MPRKKELNENEYEYKEAKSFNLRKNMVEHFTAAVIAPRNSGKSKFLKHLMYEWRDIPRGIVFCPEEDADPFFQYFFPPLYIHEEITEELLKNIWEKQGIEKIRQKKYLKDGLVYDISLLIVGDDVMADVNKWENIPEIKKLFKNGRHRNVAVILTLQGSKDLKPNARSQFNYIFLLKNNNKEEVEKLYKIYGTAFAGFDEFKKTHSMLTKNYGIMVLDMKHGDCLENMVYQFRARLNIENFIFGSTPFQQYHFDHFDKYYEEKIIAKANPFEKKTKKKLLRIPKNK